MPLCDLFILSLNTDIPAFLRTLRSANIKPLIQSRVVRWVILPTALSTGPLLANNVHWDLVILLSPGTPLPQLAQAQIKSQWHVAVGVPGRLLENWDAKNGAMLNPSPGSIPAVDATEPLTAPSSQTLELSPELSEWISSLPAPTQSHPISMLNLLAFNPSKKEQYAKYGAAFAERIGARHGGNAKIVGNAIKGRGKEEGWAEVAIAHYPSLKHFRAMIGSEDYQAVNKQHRLGALKDTCILCTMEIDDNGQLAGRNGTSKL